MNNPHRDLGVNFSLCRCCWQGNPVSVRSTTNTLHNVFPKCRHCCLPKNFNLISEMSQMSRVATNLIKVTWHLSTDMTFIYIMTFYQAAIITKRTYITEPHFFVVSGPTDPTHYQVWPDSLPVHSLPFLHLTSIEICLFGMFRLFCAPFDHVSG